MGKKIKKQEIFLKKFNIMNTFKKIKIGKLSKNMKFLFFN